MRVTKITATGMSRTPTVQYGYVEKHFTFEAIMEEGEDKGLATDILNRMIARAFGADKPVVDVQVKDCDASSNAQAGYVADPRNNNGAPAPVEQVDPRGVGPWPGQPGHRETLPVVDTRPGAINSIPMTPSEIEAENAVAEVEEARAVETISAEDFGRTLAEYAKANGATRVLELRSKYGVATVAQLPAEKRAEFLADLRA